MNFYLDCALKWGESMARTAGIGLAAVAFIVVVIFLTLGVVDAVNKGRQFVSDRLGPSRYLDEDYIIGRLVFVVLAGVTLTWFGAVTLEFMQSEYGCDECLPASLQKGCDDKEAAEVQAREEFEDLCIVWQWDDCPDYLKTNEGE